MTEPPTTMEWVLLVDDDPSLLRLVEKHLSPPYKVDTARNADDALHLARRYGPYAVVISDFKMPGRSGVELLATFAREYPDTSRIMLTGRAEVEMVTQAINSAKAHFFLQKPVCKDELLAAVLTSVRRFQQRCEQERMQAAVTLGIRQTLIHIAAAVNPAVFRRSQRLSRLVGELARKLELNNTADCETAALLSHLGFLAVPSSVLQKAARQEYLTPQELSAIQDHGQVAYQWLAAIEPLYPIAEIIRYQSKHYDGTGRPEDDVKGEEIPIGARLLKVAHDYDALEALGGRPDVILREMNDRQGMYDPVVLDALNELKSPAIDQPVEYVSVDALLEGRVLAEHVTTTDGRFLFPPGTVLDQAMLSQLAEMREQNQLGPFVAVFRTAESTSPPTTDHQTAPLDLIA